MKLESINLYFIPEEYRQQILDLIQSKDMNNWDLLHQLMIGFNTIGLSSFALECYFRAILNDYRMNHIPVNNHWLLNDYLYTIKSYKQ